AASQRITRVKQSIKQPFTTAIGHRNTIDMLRIAMWPVKAVGIGREKIAKALFARRLLIVVIEKTLRPADKIILLIQPLGNQPTTLGQLFTDFLYFFFAGGRHLIPAG